MQLDEIEQLVVELEKFVRLSLTILLSYMVVLWVAAIWWTIQDIRSRTTSLGLQFVATVLVLVFNFAGLLLYFILRPQRTLSELYAESLEEEALIRTVNDAAVCPLCERPMESDWLFCPWCQARLRQRCQRCERPILLRWHICPYCGTAPSALPRPAASARELVKP
ncbi:MAG: zinc ribbon domain-containing protein [Chloroflexi bacterium]|nr:zinc ribbon domain-containing protein [Chloroflexota bacterium]